MKINFTSTIVLKHFYESPTNIQARISWLREAATLTNYTPLPHHM